MDMAQNMVTNLSRLSPSSLDNVPITLLSIWHVLLQTRVSANISIKEARGVDDEMVQEGKKVTTFLA